MIKINYTGVHARVSSDKEKNSAMAKRQIQIPEELFLLLCQYFFLDDRIPEHTAKIEHELEVKLKAIERRDTYTKAAQGDDSARKKYLDMQGIPEDFRW